MIRYENFFRIVLEEKIKASQNGKRGPRLTYKQPVKKKVGVVICQEVKKIAEYREE